MENIFNDYASWFLEQASFIEELTKLNSSLLKYNKHVIDVVKHLYNKVLEEKKLSSDEETIFTTGFYYLFEQFEQINLILKHHYDDNVIKFNKQAKTMLLLLDLINLENELYDLIGDEEKLKPLIALENEIIAYLAKNKQAPKSLFDKLNQVSELAFLEVSDDFYPLKEIFYDIADEYNLL